MRTLFIAIALLVTTTCLGQYLDPVGAGVRLLEKIAATEAEKAAKKTSNTYLRLAPTTAAEGFSRTKLNKRNQINYLKYRGMCNRYFNPFKKRACTNKFNFLKEAHTQVLTLVNKNTINQINQGVKELIGEKYIHITNIIQKELQEMKNESEKSYIQYILNK